MAVARRVRHAGLSSSSTPNRKRPVSSKLTDRHQTKTRSSFSVPQLSSGPRAAPLAKNTVPCRTMHRHAEPVPAENPSPGRALPCHAPPRRSVPCRPTPSPAMKPRAMPRRNPHCPASPGHAAMPNPAMKPEPSRAKSCQANTDPCPAAISAPRSSSRRSAHIALIFLASNRTAQYDARQCRATIPTASYRPTHRQRRVWL